VNNAYPPIKSSQFIGQLTSTVGRLVIYHNDVGADLQPNNLVN
jgi:hypothetical protein